MQTLNESQKVNTTTLINVSVCFLSTDDVARRNETEDTSFWTQQPKPAANLEKTQPMAELGGLFWPIHSSLQTQPFPYSRQSKHSKILCCPFFTFLKKNNTPGKSTLPFQQKSFSTNALFSLGSSLVQLTSVSVSESRNSVFPLQPACLALKNVQIGLKKVKALK